MRVHPKPEKKKSPPPSENIQVPPIPKQTAGAVTGAAIGSIAGPVGAMVGGVVGALAGKAATSERPVRKAVKRAKAVSKRTLRRHPVKSPCLRRKGLDLDNLPQQGRTSERYTRVRSRNAIAVARKGVRTPVPCVNQGHRLPRWPFS